MNNDLTNKLNTAQAKVRDVLNNREDAHGPIGECFTGIAQVWSGLVGIDIMPQQVAYMLAAMKMVRHRHNAYESDHALDIHGYAAIAHVMDDDGEEDEGEEVGPITSEINWRSPDEVPTLNLKHFVKILILRHDGSVRMGVYHKNGSTDDQPWGLGELSHISSWGRSDRVRGWCYYPQDLPDHTKPAGE